MDKDTSADEPLDLYDELRLLVDMVIEQATDQAAEKVLPWLEENIGALHKDCSAEKIETAAEKPWCPWCALQEIIRGQRPDFVATLVEQAAQLVALLRAVLADRWYPNEGIHMPGFRPRSELYPLITGASPDSINPDTVGDTPIVQQIPVFPRKPWS